MQGGEDGIARNTGGSLSKTVLMLRLLGGSSRPIDPGGKVGCGEEANLLR